MESAQSWFLMDLLQVSLLIKKQTGGKKKRKGTGLVFGMRSPQVSLSFHFAVPFLLLPSRLFIDQERDLEIVQDFNGTSVLLRLNETDNKKLNLATKVLFLFIYRLR